MYVHTPWRSKLDVTCCLAGVLVIFETGLSLRPGAPQAGWLVRGLPVSGSSVLGLQLYNKNIFTFSCAVCGPTSTPPAHTPRNFPTEITPNALNI